jgi:hypothetical protein
MQIKISIEYLSSPLVIVHQEMKYRKIRQVFIFSGIAALIAIVLLMVFLQLESAKAQSFVDAYENLIKDSRILTEQYHAEIAKWKVKQYDNHTMISVTDDYIPKFEKIIKEAQALHPPQKYSHTLDLILKSYNSEILSYKHFRNYLVTGSPIEDEESTELLSDALRYESGSFDSFRGASE